MKASIFWTISIIKLIIIYVCPSDSLEDGSFSEAQWWRKRPDPPSPTRTSSCAPQISLPSDLVGGVPSLICGFLTVVGLARRGSWGCPPSCSGSRGFSWGAQCCCWESARTLRCGCGWSISQTCFENEVLEGDAVVVVGVFGDAVFNLLRLRVIAEHPLAVERWRGGLHLHVDATILLLCLHDPLFGGGVEEGGVRVSLHAFGGGVGGVASEWLGAFQFAQQLDVTLVDLDVLLVKAVGEGFTLDVAYVLELGESAVVALKLVFAVLSDFGEFFEMVFVGAAWVSTYTFWL